MTQKTTNRPSKNQECGLLRTQLTGNRQNVVRNDNLQVPKSTPFKKDCFYKIKLTLHKI